MTNPKMHEPLVYDLYEPSNCVWQYCVVDPKSHHCIVIDPVLEFNRSSGTTDTRAADAILDLIRTRGYVVDHLLTTYASRDKHTAIWYLRMQLFERQGFAPRVRGGEVVAQLQDHFQRKYGLYNTFRPTLDDDPEDATVCYIGSLPIQTINLAYTSPRNASYVIGQNVFGALSICSMAQGGSLSNTENCVLRDSVDKVFSLPKHFRLLPDHGQQYDPIRTPYMTVAACMEIGRNRELMILRKATTEYSMV